MKRLLTLSRVESNEQRAPDQQVVLQTVTEEACAPLALLADKSEIRIETAMPDDPIRFQGDADEIVRAIRNLVENAIRYGNPRGVVKVCGSVHQPATGAASVQST